MRSDKPYERLTKLWASVCELVLKGNRHLESVTAALQRIVFEEHGYPRFKVWKEICEVGKTNHWMMWALVMLEIPEEMDQMDDASRQIIAAFPQCFGPKEVTGGPYPLSALRMWAEEASKRENGGVPATNAGDSPVVAYTVIPNDLPIQGFDKFGNREAGFGGPILPKGIDPKSSQGSVVSWNGEDFVVIENNKGCEELWIAPVQCIVVDI